MHANCRALQHSITFPLNENETGRFHRKCVFNLSIDVLSIGLLPNGKISVCQHYISFETKFLTYARLTV